MPRKGSQRSASAVLSNITPSTNRLPTANELLQNTHHLSQHGSFASWRNSSLSIYMDGLVILCLYLYRTLDTCMTDLIKRKKEKCSGNVLLCSENIKKLTFCFNEIFPISLHNFPDAKWAFGCKLFYHIVLHNKD